MVYEDPPVNFNLERIKSSVESGYIELPYGLTIDEMREHITACAAYIKMRDAMRADMLSL